MTQQVYFTIRHRSVETDAITKKGIKNASGPTSDTRGVTREPPFGNSRLSQCHHGRQLLWRLSYFRKEIETELNYDIGSTRFAELKSCFGPAKGFYLHKNEYC